MNFLFIALASVLIAVEVINTQTKDGEINKEKQYEIIGMDSKSIEKKIYMPYLFCPVIEILKDVFHHI